MAIVYPPTFGSDGTALIQSGIDTGDAVVTVTTGTYIISSPGTFTDSNQEIDPTALIGRSDQTIIFKAGCKLKAASGSFLGKYQALLGFQAKSNCYVTFEQGAFIAMRKTDYQSAPYTAGEHRHCIKFVGCTNYGVSGVNQEHLQSPGGDCLIIQHVVDITPANQTPCTNGLVSNIILNEGHRQGCSVTSATGLIFNHVRFSNTAGTAPKTGCDLEPDHVINVLINIVFNDCIFDYNFTGGPYINLSNMNGTSQPVSITYNNCVSKGVNATQWGGIIEIQAGKGPPSGTITFNNCTMTDLNWAAFQLRWDVASNVILTFNNLQIYQVSQLSQDKPLDFVFYGTVPSTIGGIRFINNCTIHETQNRKVTNVTGSVVATNVTGTIRLNRLNRPITTSQVDSLLPNLVIEPYAKDVRFLEKIYNRIWVGRRKF